MTWELPENPFPPDTVCVQLELPNDPAYLNAFWGQLLALASYMNWQKDTAHTARLAARRMRQVYLAARENDCPPANTGPGFFLEDCMNIKQDPDNPCLLREVCPDGSLGCTIFDASLCKPNPAPGGGTTQPGSGQCNTYKIDFQPGVQTPLPFVVNSGDTIEVQGIEGAGTDNGGTAWRCPDGELFVLGGCAGNQGFIGGDPLPSAPHMSVLFLVNGAYHLATGTFTVPPGITNLPIFLVLNTASTGPFAGSYRMALQFCNNTTNTASWCRTLDLTISPYGGVPSTGADANGHHHPNPYWTAGIGWETDLTLIAPSTTNENEPRIQYDLGAVTPINYCHIDGHVFAGGGGQCDIFVQASNDPTFATGVSNLIGGFGQTLGADFSLGGTIGAVSFRYVRLYCDYYSSTAALAPAMKFVTMVLKGTGTSPTLGAPC